jgi:hypothetical protein
MDTSSNQQIGTDEAAAPTTFSHPRGYVNEDGEYAIWVGTPPGFYPDQIRQETAITNEDLTPEQMSNGSDDDDFVEVLRPSADRELETALPVTERRNERLLQ